MFSRSTNRSNDHRLPAPTGAATPSIISIDMRVAGDLRTDGDVQIDGVVDGDISSTSLTVGKSAEINGEISADVIHVWGRVNGQIRARDVTIEETAEVHGDIHHEHLQVQKGAQIDGMLRRLDSDEMGKQPRMNLVLPAADSEAPKTAVAE